MTETNGFPFAAGYRSERDVPLLLREVSCPQSHNFPRLIPYPRRIFFRLAKRAPSGPSRLEHCWRRPNP